MATNKDKNFVSTFSEFVEKLPSEIVVRDVDEITTELTTVIFEANSQEMIEYLPKFVHKICDFGRVQEIQCKDTDIVGVDDFRNVKTKAGETMRCLIIVLKKVRRSFEELGATEKVDAQRRLTNVLDGIVTPILILIGEQHGDYMWTSRESVKLSQSLMKVLLALCQCSTLDMLFSSPENRPGSFIQSDIFGRIMKEIKPRLRKDNWKRNPSLVRVCIYYLHKVKMPQLSNHLDIVLPPSLSMVDDHELEYKILGVTCLQHIIDNTTSSELNWYGRAGVIYEALQHQLLTREAPLLSVTLPCLLSCLKVVEFSKFKGNSHHIENRYDEILQKILTDMEMENLLRNRRIFSEHVVKYIETMDVTVVRHLPRLLRVVCSYLEVSDGPEELARLNALDMLEMTFHVAWPRLLDHCENLFKILIKLLYDISVDKSTTKQTVKDMIIGKITVNIILLKRAVPQHVVPWLIALKDTDSNDVCQSVFRAAIADYDR